MQCVGMYVNTDAFNSACSYDPDDISSLNQQRVR